MRYDAPDDSARARRELIVAMCQKADRTLNQASAPTIAELTDALNEVLEHAIELHRREYGVPYYTELYEDDVTNPAGAELHDNVPMGLLDRTALGGKAAAVLQIRDKVRREGGTIRIVDPKASDDFAPLGLVPGLDDQEDWTAAIEQAHQEMQNRIEEQGDDE
jgi:hypothetical protein